MEKTMAKATEPNSSIQPSPQTKEEQTDSFQSHSPTKSCIRRIQSDLDHLAKDPIDGIFAVLDETRVNVCHAMIIGPSDTPYECGFFYFLMEFPDDYPHVPPRVTLQTTGGGVVRFNPNLYRNGKVCLSILGTWNGPSWSPVQTIGSVLLSIRSLMNSSPYHNEPGFEDVPISAKEPKNYNHLIRHETLRVAVLDMVDFATKSHHLPERLAGLVCRMFVDSAEFCKYTCDEYSFLDKRSFQDPFSPTSRGSFDFARLKHRIEKMEEEIKIEHQQTNHHSVCIQHETNRHWNKTEM